MLSNVFKTARAHIKGSTKYPKIDGIVTFKETKNGVLLTAKVNGVPQSKEYCQGRFFGFHIHERNFMYWK